MRATRALKTPGTGMDCFCQASRKRRPGDGGGWAMCVFRPAGIRLDENPGGGEKDTGFDAGEALPTYGQPAHALRGCCMHTPGERQQDAIAAGAPPEPRRDGVAAGSPPSAATPPAPRRTNWFLVACMGLLLAAFAGLALFQLLLKNRTF